LRPIDEQLLPASDPSLTQNKLAAAIDVPPRRINEIVHGQRAITADTALRLSKVFGLSDMFWINMQSRYDAEITRLRLKEDLQKIHRIPTGRTA
jgi:antitoxin HigA-1